MKVCYVGCYRDGTGYANSAIAHMLALDAVGVEVVARPVKMTGSYGTVPDRIESFERNDLNNVDVVIQHNLPSEFVHKGGVLNVGNFAYETDGFPNTDWKFGLGLMDKIICPCALQANAVVKTCGEKFKDKIVPLRHPVDVMKFRKFYEPMDFGTPRNTVKFYTISEFTTRKNLPDLLIAYYSEFDRYDNVLLIVKTHFPNRNEKESMESFRSMCNEVKDTLGRFKDREYYPKVAAITSYLPEDQVNSLHVTGDVFVSASHGEAICLPYVDAQGFGRACVVPNHSAFVDYASGVDPELLVDSTDSMVFGVKDAPTGLYTTDERWGNVSVLDLGRKMRYAYENIDKVNTRERAISRIKSVQENLSFKSVGEKLKEELNAAKA